MKPPITEHDYILQTKYTMNNLLLKHEPNLNIDLQEKLSKRRCVVKNLEDVSKKVKIEPINIPEAIEFNKVRRCIKLSPPQPPPVNMQDVINYSSKERSTNELFFLVFISFSQPIGNLGILNCPKWSLSPPPEFPSELSDNFMPLNSKNKELSDPEICSIRITIPDKVPDCLLSKIFLDLSFILSKVNIDLADSSTHIRINERNNDETNISVPLFIPLTVVNELNKYPELSSISPQETDVSAPDKYLQRRTIRKTWNDIVNGCVTFFQISIPNCDDLVNISDKRRVLTMCKCSYRINIDLPDDVNQLQNSVKHEESYIPDYSSPTLPLSVIHNQNDYISAQDLLLFKLDPPQLTDVCFSDCFVSRTVWEKQLVCCIEEPKAAHCLEFGWDPDKSSPSKVLHLSSPEEACPVSYNLELQDDMLLSSSKEKILESKFLIENIHFHKPSKGFHSRYGNDNLKNILLNGFPSQLSLSENKNCDSKEAVESKVDNCEKLAMGCLTSTPNYPKLLCQTQADTIYSKSCTKDMNNIPYKTKSEHQKVIENSKPMTLVKKEVSKTEIISELKRQTEINKNFHQSIKSKMLPNVERYSYVNGTRNYTLGNKDEDRGDEVLLNNKRSNHLENGDHKLLLSHEEYNSKLMITGYKNYNNIVNDSTPQHTKKIDCSTDHSFIYSHSTSKTTEWPRQSRTKDNQGRNSSSVKINSIEGPSREEEKDTFPKMKMLQTDVTVLEGMHPSDGPTEIKITSEIRKYVHNQQPSKATNEPTLSETQPFYNKREGPGAKNYAEMKSSELILNNIEVLSKIKQKDKVGQMKISENVDYESRVMKQIKPCKGQIVQKKPAEINKAGLFEKSFSQPHGNPTLSSLAKAPCLEESIMTKESSNITEARNDFKTTLSLKTKYQTTREKQLWDGSDSLAKDKTKRLSLLTNYSDIFLGDSRFPNVNRFVNSHEEGSKLQHRSGDLFDDIKCLRRNVKFHIH